MKKIIFVMTLFCLLGVNSASSIIDDTIIKKDVKQPSSIRPTIAQKEKIAENRLNRQNSKVDQKIANVDFGE